MREDEQALIVRVRAGDQTAFQHLVQGIQGRAYGVAHGMLGNRDDAMDALQEAFVRAYRNIDRFRGTSSFYTWFYRILVNSCIDLIRKRKRHDVAEFEEGQTELADESEWPVSVPSRPDDDHRRKQLRKRLDAAMAELSENHRAVILMREVEGLSYSEMAKAMKCSKGTIMSRLFHARKRLQKALASGESEPSQEEEHVETTRQQQPSAATI